MNPETNLVSRAKRIILPCSLLVGTTSMVRSVKRISTRSPSGVQAHSLTTAYGTFYGLAPGPVASSRAGLLAQGLLCFELLLLGLDEGFKFRIDMIFDLICEISRDVHGYLSTNASFTWNAHPGELSF